ncbi:hypothetical protein V6N13_053411 [Hibiscus sabdariffa]
MYTADSVEVCAFKEGVELIISNDWTQVIFEGDAYNIVSKLERKELDRSLAAAYLLSTVEEIANHPGWTTIFQHIEREANGVADRLAKMMRGETLGGQIFLQPPAVVTELMELEARASVDLLGH